MRGLMRLHPALAATLLLALRRVEFAANVRDVHACRRQLQAHDVPNDAVLASGVERLQYDKKGLVAVRVKKVLQLVHTFDVFLDLGEGFLMRLRNSELSSYA